MSKEKELENIFDVERQEENMFAEEYEERQKRKLEKPDKSRIQQEENIFDRE